MTSDLILAVLAQQLTIIGVHDTVPTPSARETAATGVRPSNTAISATITTKSCRKFSVDAADNHRYGRDDSHDTAED